MTSPLYDQFYIQKMKDNEIDYLIVIDLEATCDDGYSLLVSKEQQEIIEFPFVVYSTTSNSIVHTEQYYVVPMISPITKYCTSLTGITMDLIQTKEKPLQDIIFLIEKYIDENILEQGHTFCFTYDGTWDILWMFWKEVIDKQLSYNPLYWRSFLNIKTYFADNYPHSDYHVTPGLKYMCTYLNVELSGRHHSGIDDCHSIVNIIQKMTTDGIVFNSYCEIKLPHDPYMVPIKDFNVHYLKDQLDIDSVVHIFDLEDRIDDIQYIFYLPYYGIDSKEHNIVIVLNDFQKSRHLLKRNNVLCDLIGEDTFRKRISENHFFTIFIFFLRLDSVIFQKKKIPEWSLCYPSLKSQMVSELGHSIGLAHNNWKWGHKRKAMKGIVHSYVFLEYIWTFLNKLDIDIELYQRELKKNNELIPKINSFEYFKEYYSEKIDALLPMIKDKLSESRNIFIQFEQSLQLCPKEFYIPHFLKESNIDTEILYTYLGVKISRHPVFNNLVHLDSSSVYNSSNLEIINQSFGIVLDEIHQWKVVCPPVPTISPYENKLINFNQPFSVTELNDGILCNLYYYSDRWILSTVESVDATQKFDDMALSTIFWEAWQEKTFKLPEDTTLCYTFIFTSPLIDFTIVQYDQADIVLISIYSLAVMKEIPLDHIDHSYKTSSQIALTDYPSLAEYLSFSDPLQLKGVLITQQGSIGDYTRVSWKSPSFTALESLISFGEAEFNLITLITNKASPSFLSKVPKLETKYLELNEKYDKLCTLLHHLLEESKHLDKREFAIFAKGQERSLHALLFNARNSKEPIESIIRKCPPKVLERLFLK